MRLEFGCAAAPAGSILAPDTFCQVWYHYGDIRIEVETMGLEDHPGGLVVVTNREPYIDEKTSQGIRRLQSAGGVVSALDPLLRKSGGAWVAWGSGSADRETAPHGIRMVPPSQPKYPLHRVFLSPEEILGYYNRYSNQGLWPLSHMLIERAQFSREAFQQYRRVNQKFSRRVAQMAPPNGLVFSHDYHLALFPRLLREQRSDVAIAHFWHIPWPPFTLFRLCPQHQEITRGLLGADILGFQTPQDVDNFMTAVERGLKVPVDRTQGVIQLGTHRITVRDYPISVDITAIEEMVKTPRIQRWTEGIRKRTRKHHVSLAISVDRADYTKGLLPRLEAIDRFFSRYPEHQRRMTFLQVVVPTRTEVREYRRLYGEVMDASRQLNAKYGDETWTPLVHIRRSIDRPRLMGLFRAADFALVSSLFDGMNLVAKEFVSAQIDNQGVLLLSDMAGAAQELDEAFHFNPLDPDEVAEQLHRAALTAPEDRARRIQAMRQHIHHHTIYDWIAHIVEALNDVADTYATR